jgi:hypothetical protein
VTTAQCADWQKTDKDFAEKKHQLTNARPAHGPYMMGDKAHKMKKLFYDEYIWTV